MRSNIRRSVAIAAIGAAAFLGFPGVTPPSTATADATSERIAGDDRYETAALIAADTFPEGATNAIIAFGLNFPDALAASYLAGFVDGPILLTETDSVPEFTTTALEDLGVETCYIVGGPNAVGEDAEAELEEICETVRIAGADRYETAGEIATSPPSANVGTLGTNGRTALVATGEKFADALAAGPIAAAEDFPVILTRPDELSTAASDALDDLEIEHVLLLGGTTALTADVQEEIEDKEITVDRFAGDDRQHTAVLLAEFGADELGDDLDHINVAAGADSSGGADALALAPHGAAESPTLLCETVSTCGDTTLTFVEDHAATISSIHIAGGEVRISQEAEDELLEAAQSADAESPTITAAEAVDDTTIELTMSEPVEAAGEDGTLDPTQFTYDTDGDGAEEPVPADAATVSEDGLTITLEFPAETVDPAATDDVVTYDDDDDEAVDDGDVVDADGNPLVDETEPVTAAEAPEGTAPTITKAVALEDEDEVVLTMSEAVAEVDLDETQWAYAYGDADAGTLPAGETAPTSAVVSGDGMNISLLFPDGTVEPNALQSEFDAVTYTDGDAESTEGDVVAADDETPMADETQAVDSGSRPTIVSVAKEDATHLVVTFSEAVKAYGGTFDLSQFSYDPDGDGGDPAVAPTEAEVEGAGLRLTFDAGVLETGDADELAYDDDDDTRADDGDVVDADGAALADDSIAAP